jgi:hypothetical protein
VAPIKGPLIQTCRALCSTGLPCEDRPQHGGSRTLTFIVLFGLAVVGAAVLRLAEAIRMRPQPTTRMLVGGIVGVALIAYGMLGFFGAFVSATGRLPWTSKDTALPMGRVDGAVVDRDGLIYCPSTPWGRIQLYDRNKRFIRGWSVEAFGGVFRLHINAENHLEVATARRRMLYVFDREGRLLSGASMDPRSYPDLDHWRGSVIWIPTPFYLLPLTHPFFAWLVAAAGMVLVMVATRQHVKGAPPKADAVWSDGSSDDRSG